MFKLITLERAIIANRIKSYLFLIATQLRTTIISKNLSTYRKKEEFQGVTKKKCKNKRISCAKKKLQIEQVPHEI